MKLRGARVSPPAAISESENRAGSLPAPSTANIAAGGDTRAPAAAFTLIELVISSALMAMILTAAYFCLSSGIFGQKLVESRADVAQTARVTMALMTADLRCACPLAKNLEFIGMHRMLGDVEADNLDFGTHNYTPRRAREGDFCEISYFVATQPESGKLSLWRRRDPTPDDEPLAGGSREEIACGIRGLKLEYYDGFDWYDDWGDPTGKMKKADSFREHPNLFGMPEAVRITLWLDPSPSKRSALTNDTSEAPLVFQTVARLNLAGAARAQAATGSAAKPDKDTTESNDAAPEGGQQ